MATVSQNYLDGIKEGRTHFKMLDASEIRSAALTEIAFCDNVGHWAGSALHIDFINGLRDFWKLQLAKLN